MEFDQVDRKLLQTLSKEGRASHQQLSEQIGRSPTSIARRQRQLEEAGVIRGFGADIDMAALGFGVTVHLKITLASQSNEVLSAFEDAIRKSPSVIQCELMSGADDYYVTVLVSSLEHFEKIHREELSKLPGVSRMETGFVLRKVVERRLPPGWQD
ncbi:Lrp/AsnC family transcriptional regulator [Erythrobacter sp. SCSIO 43205]|uniref:Lrp/AsnC family transcriptional regulator n=1 Tax=Erythrobacter sp. SCSIO 43205 TaxID=2779361 RepID=UPI001CA7FDD3|nr:Lrp/AsnC family transcriptional regulator [Erythrobacter sp. SCSIO 43205]UAB77624.1 Lrp/AsnC family transcriptional regulator [Erythrobacter sp. SCSIO 43205]